ncbi:MAG: GspH/FimT family pseudopilin [Pseudomonadota bacterium]
MRLISTDRGQRAGFTLIELMITLVVAGLLLLLGVPSLSEWLLNGQIRTSAESILAGLQLARNEAVRRNAVVRFQLVTDLTNGCALSDQGGSWIVSLDDPTGNCNNAPSDTNAPRIIQLRAAAEGGTAVTVAAQNSAGAAATMVSFNGLGRVASGAASISRIDIDLPASVLPADRSRNLRILVTTGGQVRMCDPTVSNATDVRFC